MALLKHGCHEMALIRDDNNNIVDMAIDLTLSTLKNLDANVQNFGVRHDDFFKV